MFLFLMFISCSESSKESPQPPKTTASQKPSAPAQKTSQKDDAPCKDLGNVKMLVRNIPDDPEEELLLLPSTAKCSEVDKAITKKTASGFSLIGVHQSYAVFSFLNYGSSVVVIDTRSGNIAHSYEQSISMISDIPKQKVTLKDGTLSIHGMSLSQKECPQDNLSVCASEVKNITLPPKEQLQCGRNVQKYLATNDTQVQLEGVVEIDLSTFMAKATQVLCFIPS